MGEVSEQRRAQVQPGLDVALVYVQATIACLERVAEIYRQSAESERCREQYTQAANASVEWSRADEDK